MIRALFAVLLLVLSAPQTAHAFDDQSTEAVENAVSEFLDVFDSGDWAALSVPPGLIAFMASSSGMTPDQLRARMNTEMDQLMQRVELVSADVDWLSKVTGTTMSGVDYAFMTFHSTFVLDGRSHKSASTNIITRLDGDWYVVRIGSPNMWQLFQGAYPEFKGVAFPG